jgi:hypothetical protein
MVFYAELRNHTSRQDDESVKINAPTHAQACFVATMVAEQRGGVSVGTVLPAKDPDRKKVRYLRAIVGRVAKWEAWMKSAFLRDW